MNITIVPTGIIQAHPGKNGRCEAVSRVISPLSRLGAALQALGISQLWSLRSEDPLTWTEPRSHLRSSALGCAPTDRLEGLCRHRPRCPPPSRESRNGLPEPLRLPSKRWPVPA